MSNKRELGERGEKIASCFLERRGLKIVERNFAVRQGEIDLIARDKEEWVFVEVKWRSSRRFGLPEDSITASKKRKIIQAVQAYLQTNKLEGQDYRIDVVVIEEVESGKPVVRYYPYALSVEDGES